ncbi:myotubularin-related protein 14 [Halyomorpha halys]|uniref:myotubularin-related protein 14 n=1 Tax=Halyomorpha halys TaxID=286706 RepID=UPI0006D4F1DB|nr:myotubularin-related protein 14 [Halyomorpha halys]
MEELKNEVLQNLILYFSKNTFKAKDNDPTVQAVMQKCIDLVSLDYSCILIANTNGELCAHYPSQLIIMENEKNNQSLNSTDSNSPSKKPNNGTLYESVYDSSKLKDLFMRSRSARCRARFPLPVILFRGKNVCRSSTLSGGPEMYGRSGYDYLFYCDETGPEEQEVQSNSQSSQSTGDNWQLFDRVRSQDIRLLKTLNVGAIIDFMVEKKKVKFGLNVSSSEKVDKENRYSDFTIISLPYPGCEFFKEYRDNDYVADGLIFDWSQGHVDATIGIPNDSVSSQLRIDWKNYKLWDLITLTQNYMRLALQYLIEKPDGTLIHCISGWDRTPLFISLLRLSLWADGAIHRTLSTSQILYLTIAYDWMLFGHNLADRLSKGEEIFFFCFYFLKHLTGEEFSVHRWPNKQKNGNGSVKRTDSEIQLDGLLLEPDVPVSSQESNVSLNSSWSSISSKCQEAPPVYFHPDESSLSTSNVSTISNMSYCDNFRADSLNSAALPEHSDNSLSPNSQTFMNGNIDSIDTSSSSNGDQRSSNSSQDMKSSNSYSRSVASRTSPVAVPTKTANVRTRNDSTSSLSTGSWQFVTGTGSFRGSSSNPSCAYHMNSNNSRSNVNDNSGLADSTTTIIEDDSFIYNNPPDAYIMRRERLTGVRNLFYNTYCSSVGFKLKDGSESNSLGLILGNIAEKVGFISTQRSTV